jgi:hypothetical protein
MQIECIGYNASNCIIYKFSSITLDMDNNNYSPIQNTQHNCRVPALWIIQQRAYFSMKQFSPVPILEITVDKLAARTWRNCRARTHELVAFPPPSISQSKHACTHTPLQHTHHAVRILIKFSTVIGEADNWTICQRTTIIFATAEVIAHHLVFVYFYRAPPAFFLRPARICESARRLRFWAAAVNKRDEHDKQNMHNNAALKGLITMIMKLSINLSIIIRRSQSNANHNGALMHCDWERRMFFLKINFLLLVLSRRGLCDLGLRHGCVNQIFSAHL